MDTTPLERTLKAVLSPERIAENISAGRLKALAVSATSYASGRTVSFVQAAEGTRMWERARRESPFKATVAHGFLTASMLSRLLGSSIRFASAKMGVNYGFNRLRFTAPLPAGAP